MQETTKSAIYAAAQVENTDPHTTTHPQQLETKVQTSDHEYQVDAFGDGFVMKNADGERILATFTLTKITELVGLPEPLRKVLECFDTIPIFDLAVSVASDDVKEAEQISRDAWDECLERVVAENSRFILFIRNDGLQTWSTQDVKTGKAAMISSILEQKGIKAPTMIWNGTVDSMATVVSYFSRDEVN